MLLSESISNLWIKTSPLERGQTNPRSAELSGVCCCITFDPLPAPPYRSASRWIDREESSIKKLHLCKSVIISKRLLKDLPSRGVDAAAKRRQTRGVCGLNSSSRHPSRLRRTPLEGRPFLSLFEIITDLHKCSFLQSSPICQSAGWRSEKEGSGVSQKVW